MRRSTPRTASAPTNGTEEHGVVFRMDLDQFGTIGGVPVSQYSPPPPASYTPLNLS